MRLTAPLPDEEGKPTEEPQPWEAGLLLPVQVVLRDFAAKGLPAQGQAGQSKALVGLYCQGSGRKHAQSVYSPLAALFSGTGRIGLLLLLDGLDEVPEADQPARTDQTGGGRFYAPVSRLSHPCHQPHLRLPKTGLEIVRLSRGDPVAVFQRADPLFRGSLVPTHCCCPPYMDRDNAQGRAEMLKQAILRNDRLYSLAERPLLLTLMASLHAWRGGSLPEKRGDLYAEATDLLLDWWEQDKVVRNAEGQIVVRQTSLSELLKVGKERVQQVLMSLAFEAHQSQPDLVGTADVPEERLVGQLMHICRNDNVNPVLLVKYLSNRAGLLVPRGVKVYSFPHRTFQEYLAACYLADEENYPDTVVRLARDDPNRWREVVLLVGGIGKPVMRWSLVNEFCPYPAEIEKT